ncbi:glycoside hydrolase family 2 TIM barrel-domain containing protein [Flavobacterium ovatum]|uniref:glycoside hydrolase family 2 protein n=1 Tax=Flavobacterium ovatum TaxID=1928857 RepID=UPI00344D5A93
MNKIVLTFLVFVLLSCQSQNKTTAAYTSTDLSLNGKWDFLASNEVPEKDVLVADYSTWDKLLVPGNWDVQKRYSDYVGKGYYHRTFNIIENWKNKQIRIKFDAVYETSKVWINGTLVGKHQGGYTPFEYNISDLIKIGLSNSVVVMADNTYKQGAWWPWGGISRDVVLEANEDLRLVYQHIAAVPDFATNKVHFTIKYKVENNGNTKKEALIQSQIKGISKHSTTIIVAPNTTAIKTLEFEDEITNYKLWHFNAPVLYDLSSEIVVNGKVFDTVFDKFGIRKFEVRGEQFFLNNQAVRMNGVNRVHDHPDYGNTEPYHLIKKDLLDIKSLGCNFARLMHAPLSKNILKFCDSIGFLVVEEIPVWGDNDPQSFADNPVTKKWLEEMIDSDFNHPSVVAWSVGNELREPDTDWKDKALTNQQYNYVNSMLDYVGILDPTRLKTYVTITSYRKGEIGTEPYEKVDFISMNSYGNAIEDVQATHQKFPNKPIFVSEIGLKQIGPAPDGKLSDVLVGYLRALKKFPYVTGVSIWSYNDYRSNYKGTPASGFREWGIVDEKRNRKEAYYQLKEIYKEWLEY